MYFTQGDGLYIVRFNDQTRAYSAEKYVPNQPPTADAGPDTSTYQMEPLELNGLPPPTRTGLSSATSGRLFRAVPGRST